MDTIKCIDSVFESTYTDLDIYVVDNASEDDSVKQIEERFGEKVKILQNVENLGGSGGFGRGMRYAIEQGYPFIMTLDNDAYIAPDTIEKLLSYIELHKDVGIVGAKVLSLEEKDRIIDFGKVMDYENYCDKSDYVGLKDSQENSIPLECDFIAATTAIMRKEALEKSGGMDEECFIYYDDVELSKRIQLSGFKVINLGTAKAWHKSTMQYRKSNTFTKYYMTRNRYRYYALYLPEEKLDAFADYVIDQAFPFMYGSHYMGREDVFLTNKYILEDFMNDVRGKAGSERIQTIKSNYKENIEKLIYGKKTIGYYLNETGRERTIERFLQLATEINPLVKFIQVKQTDSITYDLEICFCGHVKDEKENILPRVYIDTHNNIVADWNDYIYFQNYDNAYNFFKHVYKPDIIAGIKKIRKSRKI